MARLAKGDAAGARADHDRAVAAAGPPGARAAALVSRSVLRRETGDTAGAAADCDEALTLDPGSATAFAGRGLARMLQGRDDEAEADLRRALALRPDLRAVFGTEVAKAREARRGKGR